MSDRHDESKETRAAWWIIVVISCQPDKSSILTQAGTYLTSRSWLILRVQGTGCMSKQRAPCTASVSLQLVHILICLQTIIPGASAPALQQKCEIWGWQNVCFKDSVLKTAYCSVMRLKAFFDWSPHTEGHFITYARSEEVNKSCTHQALPRRKTTAALQNIAQTCRHKNIQNGR